jgi:hypothetical protein
MEIVLASVQKRVLEMCAKFFQLKDTCWRGDLMLGAWGKK